MLGRAVFLVGSIGVPLVAAAYDSPPGWLYPIAAVLIAWAVRSLWLETRPA